VGYRAGSDDENDEETVNEAREAGKTVKTPGSKRGIFLLLGGLVVAGIAAGWNWMRGLPKDEP
jgi:hypothetical protein